jgi:hypothetical protein
MYGTVWKFLFLAYLDILRKDPAHAIRRISVDFVDYGCGKIGLVTM